MPRTVKAIIRGRVQGVGYRFWAERTARAAGLSGTVRNCRDGSVELVITGSEDQVAAMIDQCRSGPAGSMVTDIDVSQTSWSGEGFSVLPTT